MDAPCNIELRISRTLPHHHATSVLNEHPDILDLLLRSIAGAHVVQCQIRRKRSEEYLGVNATSLNRTLKRRFKSTGEWRYEATVRDGVIFDSADLDAKVEGFDIAKYDDRSNLGALWTACFGRRPLRNGEALWQQVRAEPGKTAIADAVAKYPEAVPGRDLRLDRLTPTILGEIQFGNWALAYRDVMKLLAATTETEVDLFVYVVADGALADMISDGTVNFSKFSDILDEFAAVVNVPTLVVGVDFPPGQEPTLEMLTAPAFGERDVEVS